MSTRFLLSALVLLAGCNREPNTTAVPDEVAASTAAVSPTETVDTSPKLPMDPALRTGQLANGLKFVIRKHDVPKGRVALWLAVDAGSVLEDDDQQGLAHFVEHMAFNGTKRFEKNQLIDFVEKSGMDFGADLNAYTSFDETVYQLTVPTDDPKLLATGFDILQDWASEITFDPTEVEKERGVVVEEWRLRRGASQRVLDQQFPIFLANSKYAERLPIGKKDIIETASVETIKRYYQDWYRPDLMTVVVVGDIDPSQVEADIKRRFEGLKNPADARPRRKVEIPLLDQTRAAVVTDPEASITRVTLAIKGPKAPLSTENDFRDQLIENLFHGMLRGRLGEIQMRPDSPYMFAFSFTGTMGREVDIFRLFAAAKTGKATEALETLTTEVERIGRHGFVATEFARQKADVMLGIEKSAKEDAKNKARGHASRIVRATHEGKALPSKALELELAKRFISDITLDEVNAYAATWTARKDRVVMASGPARDAMPTEKELLAVAAAVANSKNIAAYKDEVATGTLMASKPTPGTVSKEETIPELDLTVWTLSNGVKVVVKPTTFKNDEIRFAGFSPGGHSLASDKAFRTASLAASVVSVGGIGEHSAVSTTKLLQGKQASVSAYVSELEEGIRGRTSPKDLETAMQLVHMKFTAPRKDQTTFDAWRASRIEFVRNRDLNPQRVFFDRFRTEASSQHARSQPLTVEALETVELDQALAFYKERFADASDFTFVFVGNVDPAKLKALSETYLASLPTQARTETWKDRGVRAPKGVKKFTVERGQDPKSFVLLQFHGTAKYTADAEDDLEMLSEVLGIRLREVLREEMSGVYGAFTRGNFERRPRAQYTFSVGFGCAPDNVEKLKKAVFDVIADVKKNEIGADYVEKTTEQRRRTLETDRRENGFWLRQLSEHYRYGTDPKAMLKLDEAVERVNAKRIQKAAKRYLNTRRYVEGVLMPEPGTTESGS